MPAMDPLDRMREAAFDANERLWSVTWHLDLATFYAPLSETLVWISALADALGKIRGPFFSGLQYARNCTLHGVAIVAAVSLGGPGERNVLKGEIRTGGGSATVSTWGFLEDPEPYDPASQKAESHKELRRDYNAQVAGYSLHSRIPSALLSLGVNIWDRSTSLAPGRPALESRRARVDPQAVIVSGCIMSMTSSRSAGRWPLRGGWSVPLPGGVGHASRSTCGRTTQRGSPLAVR